MKKSKKMVLGRGLGALLTDADRDTGKIFDIGIEMINTGVYQPRQYFDGEKLMELKNSIKENGIIQPLIVVRSTASAEEDAPEAGILGYDERYDLIAGERRYRAAKELGMKTVPAIIKDLSGGEALEIALIENIQRQDLNVIEEASCYLRLIEEFNLTHDLISKKVGKERSTITNMLRMLQLPDEIKQELIAGRVAPSHARNLIGLSGDEANMLMTKISDEQLTVRETENAAKVIKLKTKKPLRKERKTDFSVVSQVKKIEDILFEELQTRVSINFRQNNKEIKGKIEIDFYSSDDLERLVGIIKKEPPF